MNEIYKVRKMTPKKEYTVEVPGSKSITNRALLLAALGNRKCRLTGVLFSDDTRGFLDCLDKLGFEPIIDKENKTVVIQGLGGQLPNPEASVNVRSAGTAARFLTVALALMKGNVYMDASEQMQKRPMEDILIVLEKADVKFEFNKDKYHFPFQMDASNMNLKQVSIDTKISSQYASALLMGGVVLPEGLHVHLEGDRIAGSYIMMTLAMMKQFGIPVEGEGADYYIPHVDDWGLDEYNIEPDVSAACYFYAMAPLLSTRVIVKGVRKDSLQGDIKFLDVLCSMGGERSSCELGESIDFSGKEGFSGVDISLKDFSDQTMTLAAIAPFAWGTVIIRNIGHIRYQESDRLRAIITELTKMGISCREEEAIDGLIIEPGEIKETEIETYEDHRMAMAFSLCGLKNGKISILNPGCCKKTFENYFKVLDSLY